MKHILKSYQYDYSFILIVFAIECHTSELFVQPTFNNIVSRIPVTLDKLQVAVSTRKSSSPQMLNSGSKYFKNLNVVIFSIDLYWFCINISCWFNVPRQWLKATHFSAIIKLWFFLSKLGDKTLGEDTQWYERFHAMSQANFL